MILLCTKNPVPTWWSAFAFPYKNVKSAAGSVPPLSHPTSCTPTKSNSYFANSLDSVFNEPDVYRLLTSKVPNLTSTSRCFGRSKVREPVQCFVTCWCFAMGSCSPPLNPKLEDHPLSAVRDCLFSFSAATLHIWRPSTPSSTSGRTMSWWQGTHLTWLWSQRLAKIRYDTCVTKFSELKRIKRCTNHIAKTQYFACGNTVKHWLEFRTLLHRDVKCFLFWKVMFYDSDLLPITSQAYDRSLPDLNLISTLQWYWYCITSR
jgi:hypothetical protein